MVLLKKDKCYKYFHVQKYFGDKAITATMIYCLTDSRDKLIHKISKGIF